MCLFCVKFLKMNVDERIIARKIRVAVTVFRWLFLRWCGVRQFFLRCCGVQGPHVSLFNNWTVSTNKLYFSQKKTSGKQNRSSQAKWFTDFPWLHYNQQSDSVVCFICVQQNEKLNLRAARNKDWVFISHGFSNWKNALVRFKEHQLSECHKLPWSFK